MEWWDHPWSRIPECVTGELLLEGWMGGNGRITILELVPSVWNVYKVLKKVEFSKKKKRWCWYSGRHKRDWYRVSHNSCAGKMFNVVHQTWILSYYVRLWCAELVVLKAVALNVWTQKWRREKRKKEGEKGRSKENASINTTGKLRYGANPHFARMKV